MFRKTSVARWAVLGALVSIASACADEPLTPDRSFTGEPELSASPIPAAPRDVPAVRIDLPPAPRPWDTSAFALAEAVAAGEGYAVIAVKEPGSARALTTGVRAAVSAGTITRALELLRTRGVTIVRLLDAIGAVQVRIAPEVAAELRDHPLVDFIEPRQYGELLAQSTPWGISMVRAPEAWSFTRGAGAKIEIIDTGHQQGHEDLPYVPSANCSGAYGGCDDGSSAYTYWHGTHVLGIATARDNTFGVVGVAPGIAASDVYVYGACTHETGSCPTDEVTAGINAGIWTVHLMNLSLRQPYDAAQSSAVAQAWNNNIVIVAAAGNNLSNTVVYPAGYSNVVGVSGVRSDKSFASSSVCGNYSNYGSHVDIAAPFEAYSTVGINSYATLCGTSMATPHVTGVAALLRSYYPSWTNQQIVDRLFVSAEDRGAAGKDPYFGYGIVDAYRALTYSPPAKLTVSIVGPTKIQPGATCTWIADVSGGTGSYTYDWYQGSLWVGSGSEYTGSKDSGFTGSSFPLKLYVSDSAGATGYHEIIVYEDSSAPICLI